MEREKDFPRRETGGGEVAERAVLTLKGAALAAAIEAGFVPRLPSGDGYNIAPFLKFWELFLPKLTEAFQKRDDFSKVVKEEGNQGTEKQKQDIPSESGAFFFPFL